MRISLLRHIAASILLLAPVSAQSFGSGFTGYTISKIYDNAAYSPPAAPLIPLSYGAITFRPGDPGKLIVGGVVGGSGAAFYSVTVTRTAGHVSGLTGPAVLVTTAPKLGPGATFLPNGAFAWSIQSGSGGVDVGVLPTGPSLPATFNIIPENPAAIQTIPLALIDPLPQTVKLLTQGGKFYTISFAPAAPHTPVATPAGSLPGGRNQSGFTYVQGGTTGLPTNAILVAEPDEDRIVAYDVDADRNPLPGTRRAFVEGIPEPSGLTLDEATGDVLVSTRDGVKSSIYRISGLRYGRDVPNVSLSSCRIITDPGYYTLTGPIAQTFDGPCINIRITSNVTIDCKSFPVSGSPALAIFDVTNLIVKNCNFQSPIGTELLYAAAVKDGTLFNNTFGNLTDQTIKTMKLYDVDNTVFANNTMNGVFDAYLSDRDVYRGNQLTCPVWTDNKWCEYIMLSELGKTNTFDANTFAGKTPWPPDGRNGAQTGLVVKDETSDVVSGNTFRYLWGGAIETMGTIRDSTITKNNVVYASWGLLAGRWNSWVNVKFTDNQILAGEMFYIYRYFGLRPANWNRDGGAPADTGVYFQNNLFSGNKLIPDTTRVFEDAAHLGVFQYLDYFQTSLPLSGIGGERMPLPSEFFLAGNVFADNDFTHIRKAPVFRTPVVAGRILDHHNNICTGQPSPYPLICR